MMSIKHHFKMQLSFATIGAHISHVATLQDEPQMVASDVWQFTVCDVILWWGEARGTSPPVQTRSFPYGTPLMVSLTL